MAAAAWLSGCTVDVGPDTGPPTSCNAPAPYFVTDVWPRYFDHYSCGQSDCHDSATGHGYFRLQSVASVMAPAATTPVSAWPAAWSANLLSVQQNLSCANPTTSAVLAIPSGRGEPHPPGTTVTDPAGADQLFLDWLK
jgi:hypothetical protein